MTRSRTAIAAIAFFGLLAAYATVPVGVAFAAPPGCAGPPRAGGEWRQYGRDLRNSRDQVHEHRIGPANVNGLTPRWVFSNARAGVEGEIESTPVVANGCLYVGTITGRFDSFFGGLTEVDMDGWLVAINADTGKLAWKRKLPGWTSTLSVDRGRIFANVNDVTGDRHPTMMAFGQATGEPLWSTTMTEVFGAGFFGSPVTFNGIVAGGTDCNLAGTTSGPDRLKCRGTFSLLKQATGEILAQDFAIPDADFANGIGGGGIWSTPAVDVTGGYAYVGTGPSTSGRDHHRAGALLKIDVDRRRRSTFGKVVDSYKGTPETYVPLPRKPLCDETLQFAICLFPDLDFGASPNLLRAADGHQVVAAGQASGIFHAVSTATMDFDWTSLVGPPTVGARAGAAAYDGAHLFAAMGFPGMVWALDKDSGSAAWIAPTLGGNQFNPITHANGVVYTLAAGDAPIGAGVATIGGAMPTGPAFLHAYGAATGALLASKPLALATRDVSLAPLAGGVVVARGKIYVPSNTLGGKSHIVAYDLP